MFYKYLLIIMNLEFYAQTLEIISTLDFCLLEVQNEN